MKQIRLKKLELINFRGIQHLEIDFADTTNIYGCNRAGKSTVANAFAWLLFGKDLEDRKDHELKPYDLSGNTANNVDVEVRAQLEINGYDSELRRVFRERWEKQRGHEVPTFKGNATETYFDGIPLSLSEYNARINGIIDERLFKLITNPLYFNNILKWQDRRAVLVEMAGEITNAEVLDAMATLNNKDDIGILTSILNSHGFDDYKKKLSADKKRLSDELKNIPSRIDQAEKSKPEVLDWLDLETQIKITKEKIAELDESLMSATKANELINNGILAKQNEKNDLQLKLSEVEFSISNKIKSDNIQRNADSVRVRQEIQSAEGQILGFKLSIEREQKICDKLEEEIVLKRKMFAAYNEQTFTYDYEAVEEICPVCGRPHDDALINISKEDMNKRIAKLEEEFIVRRANSLTKTREEGIALSKERETIQARVDADRKRLEALEAKVLDLKSTFAELSKSAVTFDQEKQAIADAIESDLQRREIVSKIQSIVSEIEAEKAKKNEDNTPHFKNDKSHFAAVLESLTTQLAGKSQIERIDKQITELRKQEKDISQQIATLEKSEFLIENFNRTKMNMVEQNINGFFEFVKFKLFEQQVNGSVVEVCHTTYNGVKWDTLNTEGKLLAGLDIINALNSFYQVSAPIMLDNRESVTNIPATNTQIVNLIVSPLDTTLRIEHTENQFATV